MPPSDRAGRLRRGARASLAVAVPLLLLGVALYPATTGPELATRVSTTGVASQLPSAGRSATVNLTDQPAFSPSKLLAIAGQTLSLTLHNLGTYPHTFTISSVANFSIPASWTPQQLDQFFTANGSLLNLTVPGGQTVFGNVSFPTVDEGATFEFVSVVPYQFQAGMSGTVAVQYPSSAGAYALTDQTTDNLRFLPATLAIPNATQFPITVSVEVTNAGTTTHTFTIEGQNNNTLLPGNFSSYFQNHPPLSSVNVPTTSGVPVWANFTITGKGAYEFICEVSGHFQGGMFGWLYVGYTPAPPPPPPSSAIVDPLVLAGAGALLGLAVVLTVVATFVGRFPRPPGGSGGHH
ncbi:MAG TPA: hypothetical protein VEY07_00290 [Thermoplasmata archaeon]|nr:hypothetical protein [Thermoplasmata archaeon]